MIVEGGETYCIDPLEDAMQVIGKRWTLLVIGILGNRPDLRFGEAKATIPGLSARALSSALQELQKHGLAERRVDGERAPPAVHYNLTERGFALRTALIPLIKWASAEGQ